MSYEDLVLVRVKFLKSHSEPFSDYREVLAPLELGFIAGGVGEVNEYETMLRGEFIFPVDPVPHDVVVGPSLKEDKKGFAVGFSLSVVKEGLWFLCH